MKEEEIQYHYFYKITNLLNDKFYYGVHSTFNLNDGYLGSGIMIKKSINKYGKKNFKKEILEFFETKELAFKKEIEIVTEELLKNNLCLNLRPGGSGGFVNEENRINFIKAGNDSYVFKIKNDKEFRDRISKNATIKIKENWKNPEFANKIVPSLLKNRERLGPESYKKVSEKAKLRTGDKNSSFGSCWIIHEELGCKRIYKKDLEEYLNQGWIKGRSISKKFVFKNTGEEFKTIYINNTIISKRIFNKDVQEYLDKGWYRGKLYGADAKVCNTHLQ